MHSTTKQGVDHEEEHDEVHTRIIITIINIIIVMAMITTKPRTARSGVARLIGDGLCAETLAFVSRRLRQGRHTRDCAVPVPTPA
jgi:hypothetical protein